MNAKELVEWITHAMSAHDEYPRKPSKAFRKWDGRTPYGIHPTWCAMTLLHEYSLPEELRTSGAQALLFHDLLEDTTADLPEGISERVRELVEGMTFESSNEEMVNVWERSPEVRLLKLFDKVSNLYDGGWMTPEKRERYREYTRKLADDVQMNYGTLTIMKFAWAL